MWASLTASCNEKYIREDKDGRNKVQQGYEMYDKANHALGAK